MTSSMGARSETTPRKSRLRRYAARDGTHDAMLLLFRERFAHHVVTASTEQVLQAWD